jgi:hypothetical protein
MKKICLLITGVTLMVCGYSQTNQQKVEKQIQDPQRKTNAGKADAIIANTKSIYDSTTFNNNTADADNDRTVKASTKRKHCGNRTKQSNTANVLKKKV